MVDVTRDLGGGLGWRDNTGVVGEIPMVGGPGNVEGSGLRYVKVAISAAQTILLATTPIEVVPAPAAGYMIEPVAGRLTLIYGSVAYTEAGDNLALIWGTAHGNTQASETIEMTGFITLTANAHTSIILKKDAIVTDANATAKSMCLSNLGSNFGNAGNSSLVVRLYYFVHLTGS